MFSSTKKAPESHANRGMDFESSLNEMHELYALRGVAEIHKGYPKTLPVGDGQWARVIGKGTVDYSGSLAGGMHVSFDAKDCAEKRIALNRLAEHQLEHLRNIHAVGGIAFVLVRFERRDVYAIPAEAWDMSVEARDAGRLIERTDIGWNGESWTATGKASINVKELPEAWKVDGYDWARTVERHEPA